MEDWGIKPFLIDQANLKSSQCVRLRTLSTYQNRTQSPVILVAIERVELSLVSYEPTAGTTPYCHIYRINYGVDFDSQKHVPYLSECQNQAIVEAYQNNNICRLLCVTTAYQIDFSNQNPITHVDVLLDTDD